MGRQVPDHVETWMKQSEANAHSVDVVDRAELLGIDHCLQPLNGSVVYEGVANHQEPIAAFGELYEVPRIRARRGQRLLHQYVEALLQTGTSDLIVRFGRCRYDDAIQSGIEETFVVFDQERNSRMSVAHAFQPLGVLLSDGFERDRWDLYTVTNEVWSPITGTNCPEPDLLHHLATSPAQLLLTRLRFL